MPLSAVEMANDMDRMRMFETVRQFLLAGLPLNGWVYLAGRKQEKWQELVPQMSNQSESADPVEFCGRG